MIEKWKQCLYGFIWCDSLTLDCVCGTLLCAIFEILNALLHWGNTSRCTDREPNNTHETSATCLSVTSVLASVCANVPDTLSLGTREWKMILLCPIIEMMGLAQCPAYFFIAWSSVDSPGTGSARSARSVLSGNSNWESTSHTRRGQPQSQPNLFKACCSVCWSEGPVACLVSKNVVGSNLS